ncbi:MAG: acetyl-CoA C-acyltransferase [Aestuariivita sp.]|nr:acetyl-CoA C-acyltransferase [Aestuariivita sp.]
MQEVIISGASRTAMCALQGAFSDLSASTLGGVAINAAMKDSGISTADEIFMGCVLSAGQGQAPARQASFAAGLSEDVPATTINKMCGSGMKAAMIAFNQISLGLSNIVIAGGMESMTNAPYLLSKMRQGARLGHENVIDHMFLDGLEDAYDKGRLMGSFAEDCAEAYNLTREIQDDYALSSLNRAIHAQKTGEFANEIVTVSMSTKKGAIEVMEDEQLQLARPEKIPYLQPAFRKNGTVTAANSSSISDGAAAVMLCDKYVAESRDLTIRAKVVGHSSYAQQPSQFTTAPIFAAQKLLDQVGWTKANVDLWEVNEAFAVVPLVFIREMGIDHEKVNVNGGACALGHPIGTSGIRILVTLLNALEKRQLYRGVAVICIGGGEATAMAVERL